MIFLSQVLIQNPELHSFHELTALIQELAKVTGEVHFKIDVKPSYPDTPANWEDLIEGAFAGVYSMMPIHFREPD